MISDTLKIPKLDVKYYCISIRNNIRNRISKTNNIKFKREKDPFDDTHKKYLKDYKW